MCTANSRVSIKKGKKCITAVLRRESEIIQNAQLKKQKAKKEWKTKTTTKRKKRPETKDNKS